MTTYERDLVKTLVERMNEPRSFIQILLGPRQTGKTTAVSQALAKVDLPVVSAAVSLPGESPDWVRAHWGQARALVGRGERGALLVIDEIQLVKQWPSVVKELWDEDALMGIDLRVVLTGSSATLLRSGLSESLAGRFEVIRSTHWLFGECRDAFGYSLDDFLFFGGYPGGARLKGDVDRWQGYLVDSIIEPTIGKDVLALEEVRNPALLSRLFYLGAPYSAQEISYRKLLGQLDDRGNAATIAHYLDLLGHAGILSGLQKFDGKIVRKRASSPRLLVHNTGLMTATYGQYRDFLLTDPERRGHLVESAVGAYLIARSQRDHFEVNWWRDGDDEVDFVLVKGGEVIAVEVKSGRKKRPRGMTEFLVRNPGARSLTVGGGASGAYGLEDFLLGAAPLF